MKLKIWFLVFVAACAMTVSVHSYMKVQAKNLKAALSSSKSVVNCSGCDLRGVSLPGLNAPGIQLALANFQPCVVSDQNKTNYNMICIAKQGANLQGINLANASLWSVNFDYANLQKANLSGADFTFGSAQHADLHGANVTDMITENAVFCNATMPDSKMCNEELGVWVGQGVKISCNCQSSTSSKK